MPIYYCPKSRTSFNVKDFDYTNPRYNPLYVYCGHCKDFHEIIALRTLKQVKEQLTK